MAGQNVAIVWSLPCRMPHGHWKTTTFVGALRCDGLTAPLTIDGAINGELFLAYVEQGKRCSATLGPSALQDG
jgi:hypothetical protein